MPIGNPINTNDIKSNRMRQESNMSAVSNSESTIGQSTQQQQQQQQYLGQSVQPLMPVSYQYVVPEQWPYPQYYQQPQSQSQQQLQSQPQMYQVQESFQSSGSDSNASNPPSTSVGVPSNATATALPNGSAITTNSNNSTNISNNVPYYYYFPQMQAQQSMAYSYPQAYYYYPANGDGTTNGATPSVISNQVQNPNLEKTYSTFEQQQQHQQQQQLQAQTYPAQPPKIGNAFSKFSKSGPPSDSSSGSMSPNSNRTSRNSNSISSLAQQPPMSNYPQPSTYQYPGFHKTSSIPNSHSPIPPRSLTTPTQGPTSQNGPLSYNLPQAGLLPPQQQQQVSPLYDGNSITPPVKPSTDQETYLTANRHGVSDQQYDSMAKTMNSFQTTTIRHPMPLIATTNATGSNTSGTSASIIRPRVTTTMWEDEKTLCYQVEANGISVVRRADNDMVNGTKLLNVTKMTRGRRDGILKAEKIRHVVKIGSMHLKGVWIPFERALAIAQREKIADYLYPLFIRDIQSVLKQNNPSNDSSSSSSSTGIKSISPRTYYQPINNYQNPNAPSNISAAQLTYSSMNLNNKIIPNNSIPAVSTIAAGEKPLKKCTMPNSNQLEGHTITNLQTLSATMPMKQPLMGNIASPLSYPRNATMNSASTLGITPADSKPLTPSPTTTNTNQSSESNVGSIHTGITLPRVESESASHSKWSKEADSGNTVPDNQTLKEPRSSQLPISALTSTDTDKIKTSTSDEATQPNEPSEAEPVKESESSKSQVDGAGDVSNEEIAADDTKKQEK